MSPAYVDEDSPRQTLRHRCGHRTACRRRAPRGRRTGRCVRLQVGQGRAAACDALRQGRPGGRTASAAHHVAQAAGGEAHRRMRSREPCEGRLHRRHRCGRGRAGHLRRTQSHCPRRARRCRSGGCGGSLRAVRRWRLAHGRRGGPDNHARRLRRRLLGWRRRPGRRHYRDRR